LRSFYLYDRVARLLMEASSIGTIQREHVWLDDMPLALFADIDTRSCGTCIPIISIGKNDGCEPENVVWD
jgi:hypothetical protein